MRNVQFTYRGGPLEGMNAHVQFVPESEIGKAARLFRYGKAQGLYQFVREDGAVFAQHVPSEQDVAAPEPPPKADVPKEPVKSVWRQAEELKAHRAAKTADPLPRP